MSPPDAPVKPGRITRTQGIAGAVLAWLAALPISMTAALAAVLIALGATDTSNPFWALPVLFGWIPAMLLLPAIGWLARLHWSVLFLPAISLVLLYLWGSLAWAGLREASYQCSDLAILGGTVLIAGPTSACLIVAGICHLKAGRQ
jgi:hypothetical protein